MGLHGVLANGIGKYRVGVTAHDFDVWLVSFNLVYWHIPIYSTQGFAGVVAECKYLLASS